MFQLLRGSQTALLAGILFGASITYFYISAPPKISDCRCDTSLQLAEANWIQCGQKAGMNTEEKPTVAQTLENDLVQKSTGFGDPLMLFVREFGQLGPIPEDSVLNTYTLPQLSALTHSHINNHDILCRRRVRLGNIDDGGWEVCDDVSWRPISPCIIYSFGINYDFTFDDDAGTVYGCDVFSFDPSMTKQPTYKRNARVSFYRLGIGGKTGEPEKTKDGWMLHTFSDLKTMLSHKNSTIIDVVKMDVEEEEWRSLDTMINEHQLHNVRQLLVEYHMNQYSQESYLRKYLSLYRSIQQVGFRKFYVSKNHWCTKVVPGLPFKTTLCYEVHYVNTNFIRRTLA